MSETAPTQGSVSDQNEGNSQEGNSFVPITSQEEFDQAIKKRISRAEASARKAAEEEYAEQLEKARKFDELEEQNKSELTKATERAEKAEQELQALKQNAELNALRVSIAEETGVPASVIRGNNEDDMRAHAEAIKEVMQPGYPKTPSSGKPSQASTTMTKEEIMGIKDKKQRQKAISENLSLFVK